MLIKKNYDRKAQTPLTREILRIAAMAIFKIFREQFAFYVSEKTTILIGNNRLHNDFRFG